MPLDEVLQLTCPNWAGGRKVGDAAPSVEDHWRAMKDGPYPPRKKLKKGERTLQYTGEKGQERLTSIEFSDGSVTYYSGDKGQEQKEWSKIPAEDLPAHKPYLIFYEGPKGEERIVRTVSPNGNRCFYEGEQGSEHLVRIESATGSSVCYYDGPKGAERKWKLESETGTEFYKGNQGQERRVRTVYHNGRMQHYRGAKGKEQTWRVLHPDGQVDVYDTTTTGSKSKIQFSIFPNGRMQHHTSGRTNPSHVLEEKQQAMKECIHSAQESLRELSENGDVNEGALLKLSARFQTIHNNFLECKRANPLHLADEGAVDPNGPDRRGGGGDSGSESEDEEESEDQGEEGDAAYREEVARGLVGIPPAARRIGWAVD